MADSIVASLLRDPKLDDRRRDIIERALKAARREQYVARREALDRSARVVFDRGGSGELRIVVDMQRSDDGPVAESIELKILELGELVFHAEAVRHRLGNGHFRTVVTVTRDIQSYWEMLLRHVS